MRNINYLFRNINLLNIFLLGGAVFFAHYILFPLLDFNVQYKLPLGEKAIRYNAEKPAVAYTHTPSISDYVPVVDNNPFHPERKIPVVKKAEEQAPPLPKPEFVLYGTLITDDISLAFIEDLKSHRNTPGRGKRQTAMKIGDSLGGFVLKQIEADKITMARGEEIIPVSVRDAQRKNTRETTITVSPKTPHQPQPQSLQQPASATIHKASVAKQQKPPEALKPNPTPQTQQGVITPPKDAFEHQIFDFVEKNRKAR